MKKKIAIAVSALILAACTAGCGSTGTSDTSSESELAATAPVEEEAEAPTEEATEAPTDEAAEAPTEEEKAETDEDRSTESDSEEELEALEDLEDIELSDEDLAALQGIMGTIEMPAYNPVDAAEEDFIGKWEGRCIVSDGTAYDSVLGMPLSTIIQMKLLADGTGVVGSGIDTEEEETESLTWTFADGSIIMTSDGDELSCHISDGELVMYSETEGEEEYVYFTKVDEFSVIDYEALYESLGLGDADIDFEDTEAVLGE